MSAIEMVSTVPSFQDVTSEKLDQFSDVYETKSAFLALAEEAATVKIVVVRSAGQGLVSRDALSEDRGVYGPAQHRRLGAQWNASVPAVNAALQAATGYELHELTDCKTIDTCMRLVGPSAHPALYPALMKLYRLQLNIEKGHS